MLETSTEELFRSREGYSGRARDTVREKSIGDVRFRLGQAEAPFYGNELSRAINITTEQLSERRHSKDYEYLPEASEALILIAMIRLMLARLT